MCRMVMVLCSAPVTNASALLVRHQQITVRIVAVTKLLVSLGGMIGFLAHGTEQLAEVIVALGWCPNGLQRLTRCRRQNINAVGMFCDHDYRLPFFRVRGKSHFCSQMHRCGCAEATLLRAADGGEG